MLDSIRSRACASRARNLTTSLSVFITRGPPKHIVHGKTEDWSIMEQCATQQSIINAVHGGYVTLPLAISSVTAGSVNRVWMMKDLPENTNSRQLGHRLIEIEHTSQY